MALSAFSAWFLPGFRKTGVPGFLSMAAEGRKTTTSPLGLTLTAGAACLSLQRVLSVCKLIGLTETQELGPVVRIPPNTWHREHAPPARGRTAGKLQRQPLSVCDGVEGGVSG